MKYEGVVAIVTQGHSDPGSREVQGFHSKGTSFLITGTALFVFEGKEFEIMEESFPWARAVIEIKPESITQTL